MHFNKLLITLVLSGVLAACGGSGIGETAESADTPLSSGDEGVERSNDTCPSDEASSGDLCDEPEVPVEPEQPLQPEEPADPVVVDRDEDGVSDDMDNCPAEANPDQVDSDGNGIGDACDMPSVVDSDSDGIEDDVDNCPADANSNQLDRDKDGIGDVCDSVIVLDADSDNAPDNVDNCPTNANPDQRDTDNDGIGDVCDPVNDTDSDNDSVRDEVDNCPVDSNPSQTDTDDDGMGDACDPVNDAEDSNTDDSNTDNSNTDNTDSSSWTETFPWIKNNGDPLILNPVLSEVDLASDGKRLAFVAARPLLAKDKFPANLDVYVMDSETKTLSLVSVPASGTQPSKRSNASKPRFSPDGSKLAFVSNSSSLVSGDNNGFEDLFLKDLNTGEVVMLSVSASGAQGNSNTIAGEFLDNNRILIQTFATNLAGASANSGMQFYIKTISTGAVELISFNGLNGGVPGGSFGYSKFYDVEVGGSSIAFSSANNSIVDGDTNEEMDIFIYDINTKKTSRVSVKSNGNQIQGQSIVPSLSSGGGKVAFLSDSTDLVAGDSNYAADLFVKDLASGEVVRVNVSDNGQQTGQLSAVSWGGFSPNGEEIAFYVANPTDASVPLGQTLSTRSMLYVKNLKTGKLDVVLEDVDTERSASALYNHPVDFTWTPHGILLSNGKLLVRTSK